MKPSTFRSLIKWFAILAAAHIVALLLFDLLLYQLFIPADDYIEDYNTVNRNLFIYTQCITIAMSMLMARIEMSYADYRKALRHAAAEPGFSIIGYYKEHHLKNHLLRLALYTVYQLPFLISFTAQGFVHTNMTLLESAYIYDVGAYVMTGSAILGLLLNVVCFAILHAGLYLFNMLLTRREELE